MVAFSHPDRTYGEWKQICLNACGGAGYFDLYHPSGSHCVCFNPIGNSLIGAFGVACCAACVVAVGWCCKRPEQADLVGCFLVAVVAAYLATMRLAETQHIDVE